MKAQTQMSNELVRDALNGDRQAMNQLIRATTIYLCYSFQAAGLSVQDAEDLAQDTVVRIWGKLATAGFELREAPAAQFMRWVQIVGLYLRREFFRKSNTYAEMLREFLLHLADDLACDHDTEAESPMSLRLEPLRDAFIDATSKLSASEVDLLHFEYFEKTEQGQLPPGWSTSPNAYRKAKSRLLQKLKKLTGEDPPEGAAAAA